MTNVDCDLLRRLGGTEFTIPAFGKIERSRWDGKRLVGVATSLDEI